MPKVKITNTFVNKVKCDNGKSNDSVYRMHIRPVFKNTPMNEINKIDIIKAHNEMISKKRLKPASANKFIIFLSSIYHLALDLQLDGISNNPCKGIKPFAENNHKERFLTHDESLRLIHAVNQSQNPNLKFVVPFLILTGARRGEVLNARWKDIDIHNMIWTIPTSKNGKKRYIPISNELHKRMHDLRHSFASALVNAGRSLYEVQILLGHSNMKMTQRYAHLSNESLLSAVSCAGKLLESREEEEDKN